MPLTVTIRVAPPLLPPAAQTPSRTTAEQETRTSEMTLMQVELDDKYRLESKRIFLSGTQALVRLPMLQRERDRLQGLNTGGFISGYRGSPLGMYDHALWRAKSFLGFAGDPCGGGFRCQHHLQDPL